MPDHPKHKKPQHKPKAAAAMPPAEPPLHYPLPRNAANCWLSGDTLFLGFPPSDGHSRGHTIHLGTSGSKALLTTLETVRKRIKALENDAWGDGDTGRAQQLAGEAELLSAALRQAWLFQSLVDTLRARAMAEASPKIGTPGAPVNAQILDGYKEKMQQLNAQREHRAKVRELRKDPQAMLEFLGLRKVTANGQ